LTRRLARVEQIGDAGLFRDRSNLGRRVDEAAAGWHMRERNELRAVIKVIAQRSEVDGARLVVADHVDLNTKDLAGAEKGKGVTDVFGSTRQNAVAALEPQRGERRVPRPGGGLDDREFVGLAAEQLGAGLVARGELVAVGPHHLIATAFGLLGEIPDRGFGDDCRRQ